MEADLSPQRYICNLCRRDYGPNHMHFCAAKGGEVVDIRGQNMTTGGADSAKIQPICVHGFPPPCADEEYPTADVPRQSMPEGSAARKDVPLCTGVLDYFPAALAAVAKLSKFGNDKHNPGQPLHWSRAKSADHADCIARHLADRGVIDPETKMSHTVEVAWRALALLQEELEAAGAPRSRGSR